MTKKEAPAAGATRAGKQDIVTAPLLASLYRALCALRGHPAFTAERFVGIVSRRMLWTEWRCVKCGATA